MDPGETRVEVPITVIDDDLVENIQAFEVELSTDSYTFVPRGTVHEESILTLSPKEGQVTILDAVTARIEQVRKEGMLPFIEPRQEHRDLVRSLDMTVAHRTLKVLGFSPALTAWYGEQRSNAQLHDYQRLRIGLRFTRDL